MAIGRNDLCPCGSGKKYKKCCLGRNQTISLAESRLDRAYQRLLIDLEPFCMTQVEDATRATEQFLGGPPPERISEGMHYAILDWMAFSYRDWDDRTLLERFAQHDQHLGSTEQELLSAWSESRPGLYRVVAGNADRVRIRDCFTDDEYHVTVDSQSPPPTPGAIMLARVLPVGTGYRFGYDARTGDGTAEPVIRRALERELRYMRLQQPGAGWQDLFAQRWPLVHEAIGHSVGNDSLPPAPSGPASLGHVEVPADATPLCRAVEKELLQYVETAGYSRSTRTSAVRLWWDLAAACHPRAGRAAVWAAGTAYAFHRYALFDNVTQVQVAEAFAVSVSALSARFGEISSGLRLRELDDRYADPFDTRVRLQRRLERLSSGG